MSARCAVLLKRWAIYLAALAALASTTSARAQAGHGVGFVAGSTHGMGLSYARQYASGTGWQVSGFPYVSPDRRELFAGFALFKTLNEGKRGRAFASMGMKINHRYERYERWDCGMRVVDDPAKDSSAFEDPKSDCGYQTTERNVLALGPGVGLEVRFLENFAIYLDFPAALYVDSDEEGFSVRPIPNFGLFYRW